MLSLSLMVIMQNVPFPPAPNNIPPPPVGDVPIDSNIGILIAVGLSIAFWVLRKKVLSLKS